MQSPRGVVATSVFDGRVGGSMLRVSSGQIRYARRSLLLACSANVAEEIVEGIAIGPSLRSLALGVAPLHLNDCGGRRWRHGRRGRGRPARQVMIIDAVDAPWEPHPEQFAPGGGHLDVPEMRHRLPGGEPDSSGRKAFIVFLKARYPVNGDNGPASP